MEVTIEVFPWRHSQQCFRLDEPDFVNDSANRGDGSLNKMLPKQCNRHSFVVEATNERPCLGRRMPAAPWRIKQRDREKSKARGLKLCPILRVHSTQLSITDQTESESDYPLQELVDRYIKHVLLKSLSSVVTRNKYVRLTTE